MASGEFLNIHPTELKFPFEVKKQSSCAVQLTNKTDQYIAFKVKTTNPKKYCVRPNAGVVLPGSTCNVTVTMQAQKEAPLDMQSKDKFLIQSVVAPNGTMSKDVVQEMFNRVEGKVVGDFKLRVVYIPANPPSPVLEGSEEEGSPPRSSDNDLKMSSLSEAVTRSLEEPKGKSISHESSSMVAMLTQEKSSALQQNQKLHHELDTLRRNLRQNGGGYSMVFVVMIFLVGMFIGYLIKS